MCYELLRHCFCKVGINDSNIGSNLEVSDRILDTLVVICDDRECGNFSSCTRCRRNSAEVSFLSEFGNTEYLTHIFKCAVGVLVLYPHSLSCVDRRTAAYCYDPVGLELEHCVCTLHNCFNRRIRFYILKELNLHACFLKISLSLL